MPTATLNTQSGKVHSGFQIIKDVYSNIIKWFMMPEASRMGAGIDSKLIDRRIQDICECLVLSDDKLRQVMKTLHEAMEKGLKKGCPPGVGLKMLSSYVRSVPNGTEYGDYLALDLGGTNFRVLLIKLRGREAEMTGKVYEIPDSLQKGAGEMLFDHIAQCLAAFIKEEVKEKKKLSLGFTFSFPTRIEGLTKGILIHWSKGFKASGVEGKDVVELLKKAIDKRRDIDIDVAAILNDTVGTLMACAFKENSCQMGVILGTGTNACYMEKLHNVEKLKGEWENDGYPDDIIINMEWGAFGDDKTLEFIATEFDKEIDEKSINPGVHIFEKMISGMYMGELVRIVLEKIARSGLVFKGEYDAISKRDCFPTKYVSAVETEMEDLTKARHCAKTREILTKIGIKDITDEDCQIVAYVCSVISTRAAHLTAAAISQVLNRMKRKFKVTVGVDGTVYRLHPFFKRHLEEKVNCLIDKDLEYQLMLSADGSGIGAAVVAAVATRMKREAEKKARRAG